jgi:cytochrome c oxidase assembly protein subunit 15
MPDIATDNLNRSARRWAIVLVCATFPLIWVGGLVTTYGAGMAVPDWPSTYGYNLFLYPISTWILGPFDLFVEHGHRLFAALVGVFTILLLVAIYRSPSQQRLRGLALVALAGVILQGLLGGARVLFDERALATIHACTAPLFFALVVGLASMTSPFWQKPLGDLPRDRRAPDKLAGIAQAATLATGLVFLQIVLGALLRHLPVTARPGTFGVLVQFHLMMAALLTLFLAVLTVRILGRRDLPRSLKRPAAVISLVIVCQLLLGGASWVSRYGWPFGLADHGLFAGYTVQAQAMIPSLIITAHVAFGSLLLGLLVWLTARSWRLCQAYKLPLALPTMSLVIGGASCQGGMA